MYDIYKESCCGQYERNKATKEELAMSVQATWMAVGCWWVLVSKRQQDSSYQVVGKGLKNGFVILR